MKIKLVLLLIALVVLVIGFPSQTTTSLRAQEPDEGILEPYTPVEGDLNTGEQAIWRFRAVEGTVVSLYAEAVDGSLDPTLSLANNAGTALVTNDDIAYPGNTAALLQAVTMPRTDTYSVTITTYGETSGSYRLTMTFGYPQLMLTDDFEAETSTWEATEDVILDQIIGQLTLSADGTSTSGFAVPTAATLQNQSSESDATEGPVSLDHYEDFYLDAQLINVSGSAGWHAGFVLRRTANTYYAVMVNEDGQWRMIRMNSGSETVLRDWNPHPAIVPGTADFRLGILANGPAFDVFYDGAFIGQVVDADQPLLSGEIGLYVSTPEITSTQSQAGFDSVYLTTPVTLGEAEVIPTQLMPGVQALTLQELERRRVIEPGGQLGLNVTESFVQRINPGVNRLPLGGGTTYEDLVISTDVSWQTSNSGVVGCGLILGSTSESDYSLAFIDQSGGYGLASRVGESFTPGLFTQQETAPTGTQNLLVIRIGEQASLYINHRYVGQTMLTEGPGEIGVAVVNYETIDTTCRFTNTWVWQLN
jgi:ABC-type phosphate/phosphonate transport system substrate-binding protein